MRWMSAPALKSLVSAHPFVRESFDIIVNGRKIGGNAQRRLKRVVFQHGSIPILNRMADGMLYLQQRPAGLEERVTCLAAEGVVGDALFLKSVLKAAFCSTLQTSLLETELSDREQRLAAQLLHQKYTKDTWNLVGEGL